MTGLDIAFAAIGVVTVASALLAVTTRQVVHAALWLVLALGGLAGCYLVLGAEFVALVQLLVYVGAVVVLVLFALMLTRAPIGPRREHSTSRWHRLLAAVVGAGVASLVLSVLLPLAGPARERTPVATSDIADAVFGTWVWPFEALSVLLLVALVAAFAVSRMTSLEVDDVDPAEAGDGSPSAGDGTPDHEGAVAGVRPGSTAVGDGDSVAGERGSDEDRADSEVGKDTVPAGADTVRAQEVRA